MKQKDIQYLETKIDSAISNLERSMDSKIDAIESKLDAKLSAKSSEDRLWMLGGAIGLLVSNGIMMKLIGA